MKDSGVVIDIEGAGCGIKAQQQKCLSFFTNDTYSTIVKRCKTINNIISFYSLSVRKLFPIIFQQPVSCPQFSRHGGALRREDTKHAVGTTMR